METELDIRENTTLAAVRRRGLLCMNYVFWALALAGLLLIANLCSSLFSQWIAFLDGARRTFGFAPPATGPDYWILGGAGAAIATCLVALFIGWMAYGGAWSRRLSGFNRRHM